jgi:putative transposase
MPRGPRVFFENAHYHIISRGNDKREVFCDNDDRNRYISLLKDMARDLEVIIPAFALMTNHIHLYLVTPKANLAEFMFTLNNSYSHYFNRKHSRTGHLFESRYKYKLIQHDRYSLALTRYIHLNPVKAGLADNAEAYPWSSARDYTGEERFPFIDRAIVLNALSDDPDAALAEYLRFIREPIEGKLWRPFEKNRNMVLGDRDFRAAHPSHRN